MEDSNLLYEDLFEDLDDGRLVIKTSFHEMEDQMKSLSNEAEELRLQVQSLQEQNEGLSKQNEVLIRNISCLFKTAQMEISRKDKQIRTLQEESQKMKAFNSGSSESTVKAQAAVARDKSYPTAMTSQTEGKTGEACMTPSGMVKEGISGSRRGTEYATTESRRSSKDITEAPDGAWRRKTSSSAQCDLVGFESQTECTGSKGKIPSVGVRRRDHFRNGHQGNSAVTPEANLKGRIKEPSGDTEKQSYYANHHCDYAIRTSQADHNGTIGELSLASAGIGKPGRSVNLEQQGAYKERVKEVPLQLSGFEKPGHQEDNHGNDTNMASRLDCKGAEKETFPTSCGMENGGQKRDDHRNHLEKRRSGGNSSELLDEMWKRRRRDEEYLAAGNEHHRRRADERYLDSKRGERAINACRSLDAHKGSERREKWSRS